MDPQMEVLVRILLGVVGVVAGLLVGALASYSIYEAVGRVEIRKVLEGEREGKKRFNIFSDTRREKRQLVNKVFVKVQAPVLDEAGAVVEGQTLSFNAEVLDISNHGIGIVCRHFLKQGLRVEVISNHYKMNFKAFAHVRNVTVLTNGLRIGMEFVKSINVI